MYRWVAAGLRITAVCGALLLGVVGTVSVRAAGDSWYQTPNFNLTERYGTNFDAQGAMWYDPYSWGVYIWRIYLRMNIWSSSQLQCDENWGGSASYSIGPNPWYNAPFPLDYNNTPAWDYWTIDHNISFPMNVFYGAGQYETCLPEYPGVAGPWWAPDQGGVGSGYFVQ
jgi:hypothetical protein